uniref:Uncharacterized protein n=1 Tax=Heterorhabditis bacteriophora TaxID=37862 RepID=A0A1I7WM18_HETBA
MKRNSYNGEYLQLFSIDAFHLFLRFLNFLNIMFQEDRKRYKEKQKLKKKLVKLKHKEKKRTLKSIYLIKITSFKWQSYEMQFLLFLTEINSPKRKKVRREVDESVEQQALALLTPF